MIAIGAIGEVLPAWAQEIPVETRTTVPEGQPRYLETMRSELEQMRIEGVTCAAVDAQRANCEFTRVGTISHREFRIRLAYSDRTDTIYAYVERYLVVPQDGPRSDAMLRRLMELNWQMLLGKFEWDPTFGEVRLAMVLNTDSNFDRRAFRSSVRGLVEIADRYWAELDRMQRAE